jgi:hypothetical protein
MPSIGPRGYRVLDLRRDTNPALPALMKAHLTVERYWESDPDATSRSIGENITRRATRQFPDQLLVDFDCRINSLPHDPALITEENISDLGRIDLFIATWPPSDSPLDIPRDAASSPEGDVSARFSNVEQVLFWVRKHNPHCQTMCAVSAIEEPPPNKWASVNLSLGEPVTWDTAHISPAHGLLTVWSSFFKSDNVPNLRTDISLADALHPDHEPRQAMFPDRPPFALCNVAGLPMQRYDATVDRQQAELPDGGGPGPVRDRGTGQAVQPYIEELETIVGHEKEDTMAPEFRLLTRRQSDAARRRALSNAIDVRALTHIFSLLPQPPPFT